LFCQKCSSTGPDSNHFEPPSPKVRLFKPQRRPVSSGGLGAPVVDELATHANPADATSNLVSGPVSPSPVPCGYLPISIAKEETSALVDCGSSLSFIDLSLKDDLENLGFKFTAKSIPIKVADKRWVTAPGYILAIFKIRNRTFQ
jgi:hypothetical protein